MRRILLILSTLALVSLCGCAGSIFSHRSYQLRAGRIVEASPHRVVTEWPKDAWSWDGSPGNYGLRTGDERYNVCPDWVPRIGSQFTTAWMHWNRGRHCWEWSDNSPSSSPNAWTCGVLDVDCDIRLRRKSIPTPSKWSHQ